MSKQRLALLSALISTAVTVLCAVFLQLIPNGGETTRNYDAMHFFKTPVQILMFVGATVALASYIALGIFGLERKIPRTTEFSKLYKFIRLRRYALIIAAIPGLVLTPLTIAGIIGWITPVSSGRNELLGLLAILSLSTLMPGVMAMIALLVLALVTAFRKPIDPDTDRPKPHLFQIFLGAVTTLPLTLAFITIESDLYNPKCNNVFCTAIENPLVLVYGTLYIVMWVVLGTIWLRNKRKL
jgi:hypothetical protein